MNSVSPRMATPRLLAPQHTLRVGRRRVAIEPVQRAGLGVHRHHVVGPLRQVHHAVDDQRIRLPGAEHLVLHHPLRLEPRHVGRRDLVERAVALAGVGAVVGEPVAAARGRRRPAGRRSPARRGRTTRRPARPAAVSTGTDGRLIAHLAATADRPPGRRPRRPTAVVATDGIGDSLASVIVLMSFFSHRDQALRVVEELHREGVLVDAAPPDRRAGGGHDAWRAG